jgi:signal transduction histidine kinase
MDDKSTILIVDDEAAVRQILAELLGEEGYRLAFAGSGTEALAQAGTLSPDLILLDIMMPDMDGFETCRRLRANPRLAEVPILLVTALQAPEHRLRGIEAGADDYIAKPFDSIELLAKLRTITRLNRYRRLLEERTRREQAEEEVARHRRDLQRLSAQLMSAQEAERARLSRELHDELGQALTAVSLDLAEALKALPPESGDRLGEKLVEARSLTDQALDLVRRIALDLRPGILDDLGLVAALRWHLKRWTRTFDIEVEFQAVNLEERLDPEVETALYRIAQEALTNVAKHAQASRVGVYLERKPCAVVALIEDNGRGFESGELAVREASEQGAGLLGMRERVALLEGKFNLWSRPGHGTRLSVEIPVPDRAG